MSTEEFNTRIIDCTVFLKRYAISLAKNSTNAEDLLQETVLRALVNKDKIHEDTNLKAWLYTIMKNVFINNYRRNKKIGTIMEINDYKNVKSGSAISRNDGVSNIEMAYLNGELQKISSTFREPFLMHYTGFKYEEIADKLKLPIGTVKSRIFFARREIRKKLDKSYSHIN